jgi:hypothetical protein
MFNISIFYQKMYKVYKKIKKSGEDRHRRHPNSFLFSSWKTNHGDVFA